MFDLHPRLAADTVPLGTLALSRVLLMNDARFRWLILVPAREGLREIHDLDAAGRAALIEEVTLASEALSTLYRPDKINVGALGNMVEQLHVHVVARRRDDAAWPGPVWGAGTPVAYDDAAQAQAIAELCAALPGLHQAK
jgi:diadenosine tetraphosphate (Ap4A) HIT family hydrolase